MINTIFIYFFINLIYVDNIKIYQFEIHKMISVSGQTYIFI